MLTWLFDCFGLLMDKSLRKKEEFVSTRVVGSIATKNYVKGYTNLSTYGMNKWGVTLIGAHPVDRPFGQ